MKLTVIRGVPGSGKSTYAKKNFNCLIVEQDMFFMKDNQYMWSGQKIFDAVKWCQSMAMMAMSNRMDICVVNTFIKSDHIKFYQELARKHNAEFEVIHVKGDPSWKNIHSVPEEVLLKMNSSFQEWLGEKVINLKNEAS